MRREVKFRVQNLVDECSHSKYVRKFGLDNVSLADKDGNSFIKYDLVEDENGKFVNIFGLFVNVNNGDIALGQFPDPNCYVCVDNFYENFANMFFNSSKIHDWVDKNALMESLKLYPDNFKCITDNIKIDYENYADENNEYNSIIMNIVYKRLGKDKDYKLFKYFKEHYNTKYLNLFIEVCVEELKSLESVAVSYFSFFNTEKSVYDMISTSDVNNKLSLSDILDENKGDLNYLFMRYMREGVPVEFLKSLVSYGLGIENRRNIYKCIKNNKRETKRNLKTIQIGKELSSMSYLSKNSNVDIYNIIDLFRSTGWLNSWMFSIDTLIDDKDVTAYSYLIDKYSLRDLLDSLKITDRDFVYGIKDYKDNVLKLVYEGSINTDSNVMFQYALPAFSSRQVRESGYMFSLVSGVVLGSFREEKESK